MNSKSNKDVSEDVDLKKELESIQDLGRQLDYVTSKCNTVESLFVNELIVRRSKLKDLCVKFIIEHPSKLCLQVRERLWRSACYDVVSRAKRVRKGNSWTPLELGYICTHLTGSVGLITSLMLEIQEDSKYKDFRLHYYDDSGIINTYPKFKQAQSAGSANKVEKWIEDMLGSCLLNLGDLNRYFADIYVGKDVGLYSRYYNMAQDYYMRAFFLNPDSGMAHNQLGNLALNTNGGLDSTYYLLYSMVSPSAYEGAYMNLRQLLDKQILTFATIPATVDWTSLDSFTHCFLTVIRQFLFEPTRSTNFEKMCQDTLIHFGEVLVDSHIGLDADLFFRISLTTIMTVWRLQSMKSASVSTAVGIAMGIFSQIAERLLYVLAAHSHAPSPKPPFITEIPYESDDLDVTLIPTNKLGADGIDRGDVIEKQDMCAGKEEKLIVPATEPIKKTPLFRRRRRVRRASTSDDLNFSHYSSDEDDFDDRSTPSYHIRNANGGSDGECSESDESCCSDFPNYWSDEDGESDRSSELLQTKSPIVQEQAQPAFEDSSSSNGLSDSPPHKIAEDFNSDFEEQLGSSHKQPSGSGSESSVGFVIDSEELLQCWSQAEPLLVALLPFMRWIQTTPCIREVFSRNCEKVFVAKLCKIMNLLKTINWDEPFTGILGETNRVSENFLAEWKALLKATEEPKDESLQLFSYEMSEDRSMMGLQPFKNTIVGLNRNSELLKGEIMMTRAARVLAFGHWLAETNSIGMTYSKDENEFVLQTPGDIRRQLQTARMNQLRNKLNGEPYEQVEKLTQLWKRSDQKKDRRGRINRNRARAGAYMSMRKISDDGLIFVFLDLPAILNHFKIVQRIASYPKFVIVLAHSVSKTLDVMKETNVEGSEDAIYASRWFENAPKRGYNVVRTQREHEKTKIGITYPEECNNETWEFLDILENCNFLLTQELKGLGRPPEKFFGDVRDRYRVLYLTGHLEILQSSAHLDFNPIEAGMVTNVFVDKITTYKRHQGRRRRRNGKSNG